MDYRKMCYNTINSYTVHFKDGTSFISGGSSSAIRKSTIKNEFDWVSFHIEKEIKLKGKTLIDIEKIEYSLNYIDN